MIATRARTFTTASVGFTAIALTLSGCFLGGSSGSSSPSASPSDASGAVGTIEEAKGAVVRIVAEGSYVDPAEGLVAKAGSGSGFVISPDGIVVTNAHVVEGAGSIQAYVGGSDDPVNAQILGVSECNDLAVIDLTGDGYPYLDWYTGAATPGLDVYAAGFPLGDPEYTLVKGIVAKERADGDTPWASIEYTIQHDAEIQPGNSGGPLLTDSAQVVGVNYASYDPTNTSQYFAIPTPVAQEVVSILETGEDVDSIGINGFALYNPDEQVGGLWVSGIRAGSPASNAGIEPGDILLTLAGRDVVQASDNATKAGYCDVLRTQGTDAAMAAEVYRPTTDEVLSGEINNPAKPLTPIPTAGGGGGGGTTTTGFTSQSDPTGRMTVDLPNAWSDVDSEITETAFGSAGYLAAAPNQDTFLTGSRDGAGVLYLVHENLSESDLISTRDDYATLLALPADCTESGSVDTPTEYADYVYVGTDYVDCTGGLSAYIASLYYPASGVLVTVAGSYGTTEEQDLLNASIGSMFVS